jgi:hypothetical protein
MRSDSSPANDAAKREQKERGLRQFVESFLAGVEAGPTAGDAGACLLLARSPDSPVARVVCEFARAKRLQLPIRVIFTTLETADPRDAGLPALPLFAADIRLVRDPRLLDAHEQLVLGSRTSWIGDCMRRDPLKRDAYEAYSADGRGKALRAIASFERIWRVSSPVPRRTRERLAAEADAGAAHLGAIADGPVSRPARSTAEPR